MDTQSSISPRSPALIVGQGLAGTCLGWEFLKRKISFRILDRGHGGSTRVAAGLINPITGKNFEPSWRIQDFYPYAISFYKSLETFFGKQLWHPMPIQRLATTEKEWVKISSKLNEPHVAPWIAPSSGVTPLGFLQSTELAGGGWLDTRNFLALSRQHFLELGVLDEVNDVSAESHSCRVRCQGAAGLLDGQLGHHRCAKGEILTVLANWPQTHIRIGSGGWLVPIGEKYFRVGSTYEWSLLDELPTSSGKERIMEIATKIGGAEFQIIDHVAGIRPIMRCSRPLIGQISQGDWVFNGLGSKGTLYAPSMAAMLAHWIIDGQIPHPDFILTPL